MTLPLSTKPVASRPKLYSPGEWELIRRIYFKGLPDFKNTDPSEQLDRMARRKNKNYSR